MEEGGEGGREGYLVCGKEEDGGVEEAHGQAVVEHSEHVDGVEALREGGREGGRERRVACEYLI